MRSIAWRALLMRAGLASLLASLLALGGCASQVGQSSAVTSSPTATANLGVAGTPDGASGASSSPTPAIIPTATFVVIPGDPSAYGPACMANQLSLEFRVDESSIGISSEEGKVTNHSSSACSLFGFPGVQALDAQRAPMAIQVARETSGVWGGVFPEEYIQVAAGASAYFVVAWSAIPTGAQTSCPASGYFAMTPPGDSNSVTAADVIHICGGSIIVSPFRAGSVMAS